MRRDTHPPPPPPPDRIGARIDPRDNGEFGEIGAVHVSHRRHIVEHERHIRLVRGADGLVPAQGFDRLRYGGAQRAQPVPFFAQRLVAPAGINRRPVGEVHAAVGSRIAGQPHLLRRERQHRRGVAHHRAEQDVEHGEAPLPLRIVERIAVKRILPDIEVEARQVARRERLQRTDIAGIVERLRARAQLRIQPRQPVQHPAFEFGQGGDIHPLSERR